MISGFRDFIPSEYPGMQSWTALNIISCGVHSNTSLFITASYILCKPLEGTGHEAEEPGFKFF